MSTKLVSIKGCKNSADVFAVKTLTRLWLSVLIISLAFGVIPFSMQAADGDAGGGSGDVITIKDGGMSRRFSIVKDMLYVKPAKGKGDFAKVALQSDVAGLALLESSVKKNQDDTVNLVVQEVETPNAKGGKKGELRVLSRKVLVQLAEDADDKQLAAELGAESRGRLPFAPSFCVFIVPQIDGALTLSRKLNGKTGVLSAEPQITLPLARFHYPDDTYFPQQWHLLNTGQNGAVPGIDANVTNVWNTYRGSGVRILIVDDSLEQTHPDLVANVNTNYSWDYRDDDSDPSPTDPADAHGISVAGIAAARGDNGLGVVGVAYEATISGARLIGSAITEDTIATAINHSNDFFHISNNSWGPTPSEVIHPLSTLLSQSISNAVVTGRSGKGRILVFAAGNGGPQDNVNMNGFANSIYTIAVAALNDQGQQASYSTPGAALVVAAPSGRDATRPQGSTTTDVTGNGGYNPPASGTEIADIDYTQNFNGTSSASPVVTGVVALMLQANPNLGWRDVQEILIRSARQINPSNSGWITNAAGFHFNDAYGAGLVDADAAVNLAKTWNNLGSQTTVSNSIGPVSILLPENDPTGITVSFTVTNQNIRAEQVALNMDVSTTFRGDLEVYLTSPSGTQSRLMTSRYTDSGSDYDDYLMTSVRNWGESATGTWTLKIADVQDQDRATFTGARLRIFGSSTANLINVYDAPAVVEGNTTTNADFKVELTEVPNSPVTVSYLLASGSARSGEDFVAAQGTLVFAIGETNKTVSAQIIGDTINEPTESFSMIIYNPTNVNLGRSQAYATIIDDDAESAKLSVSDATVTEGDSGTVDLNFVISLSEPSGYIVTADYTTSPGTASVGEDYLPRSGTIAFEPGETSKVITVKVLGDGFYEGNETLFLNISSPTHATINVASGKGTIVDNDARPKVSIADVSKSEGDSGTTAFTFVVSLSNPTASEVTVDYQTVDGTATVAGSDYEAASGTLVFSPGTLQQTITVNVTGDLDEESNEAFTVQLSNLVNVDAGTLVATGNILNDDGPHLSISGARVVEGAASTTTNAVFTVTLEKPNASTTSVDYNVVAVSATAGVDYQTTSGTLSFPSGTVSQDITVVVNGDDIAETNETFKVVLSNVSNGTIAVGEGIGVIVDDDVVANLALQVAMPVTNIYVGHPFTMDLTVTNKGIAGATNLVFESELPSGFELVSSSISPTNGTVTVNGTTVKGTIPLVASGTTASLSLVLQGSSAGSATFVSQVYSDQFDDDTADNTVSTNRTLLDPVVTMESAGSLLVAESNSPANRGLDPGETVSMSFSLKNTGNIGTTNLVAILRSENGVTSIKGVKTYGVVDPAGGAVSNLFTFMVTGAGGDHVMPTLDLWDVTANGSNSLGTITYDFQLSEAGAYSSAATITIPTIGTADVYPSTIGISGLQGRVSKVTVQLTGVTHGFPDDLDILLVAPNGQGVILMSDAGGSDDISSVNLVFDDSASNPLPDSTLITAGTYRPTNYGTNDTFSGAPAGPYASMLGAYVGIDPNGTWKLYVVDDGAGDAGSISGWSLNIQTTIPADPVAELVVAGTSSPNPVYQGYAYTYTLNVTNTGPAVATGVTLTSQLPDPVSLTSSTPAATSNSGNLVTFDLGSLAVGGTASVTLNVTASSPGSLTNVVSVVANEVDLQPGNSTINIVTRVNRATTLSSGSTTVQNGQFNLNLAGQAGITYVIEVSTNLVDWVPVYTNTTLSGAVNFTDTNANTGQKFYRAVER